MSDHQNIPARPRFSIRSLMIITVVVAASAAGLAHLWRAATHDISEIGWFVLVTAMSPMGLMIGLSWLYRVFKNFQ